MSSRSYAGQSYRRAPARGAPARGKSSARRRAPKQSWVDRLLLWLPVSTETLTRLATFTIVGVTLAGLLLVASWFGIPGTVGTAVAEEIGRAGFRVDEIEVSGVKQMDRMTVYTVALDQKSRAMPLVDLEGVRQKLLAYGWIADAHVSRRLPNKLVIQIVERAPVAVWQERGKLTLIAEGGIRLAPVAADAMPNLPLLIGPGADAQEANYRALIDAAPALKPLVRAATWVGDRRWDLTFDSGETLALPAGDADAATALRTFAAIDGSRPLLGRGWIRFDMRDPTRLVARRPDATRVRAAAEPVSDDATQPTSPSKAQPLVIEAQRRATGGAIAEPLMASGGKQG